jgi:hypothetical protein
MCGVWRGTLLRWHLVGPSSRGQEGLSSHMERAGGSYIIREEVGDVSVELWVWVKAGL